MTCPACGTLSEPGAKFCAECGTRLIAACTVCGHANAPAARFCSECGSALAVASTTIPSPRPGNGSRASTAGTSLDGRVAERRLVTVLFADLVGSTALAEDRDPEEVREFLTRYFETCGSLIERYGGTVEKFIGDAVMAVWGVPTANEDDAERAVRAALDLTAAVVALGEEIGLPQLEARAGVLSGEAAVTLAASGQGMVAGDLVNAASRVQSAARPGQVLVGPDTKNASEGGIEYEDAGTHELKGRNDAMRLWRAVRVVGLTGGAVRSREIEPPFTGRDRELRMIKGLFHATADDSRAHLVSMLGVGGIGKSRLAWEFEKYVDGLATAVFWHRGRCLAYGDGVSFWALGEMVRARAGILEDEETDTALPKLRDALERYMPDPAERRFVEPRLAQLLGMEARSGGDQENLFSAWRLLFERLADVAPTVLLFEDLHWADAALVDFIHYLLDWERDRPIFIVTTARPELLERHPAWATVRGSMTSLHLEPLPAAQIDALLKGAVAGLPDELQSQIVQQAEGIPFYAVETVRMLVDRGLVVRTEGGYRPTGPIETLELPRTLQALITSRLDGLTADERRLLQDAAVLGRTFSVAGLAAVSGRPTSELEPLLASLVRKEMLLLERDPTSPERGQYGFLQDIVRRVAYDTLSRRDRQPRHLAAAEYLESAAGGDDDVIEVVASHRLEAYLAAPDAGDAGELRRSARDALVQAGERASSLAAMLAAQAYFEKAASLANEPVQRAELLERAGIAAYAGERAEAAATHFGNAVDLFRSTGAVHPAARVSARRAEIVWDQGRLGDALRSMDEAFQLLADDEPDADLASLAAQIGRFAFFSGNLELAEERIEAALTMTEQLDLTETFSHALNTKGLALLARGRTREAEALIRHALDVALDNDKPSAALRAYNNLADILVATDRYADARASVDEGVLMARRIGNRYWERILLGTMYPRYALGQWDAALENGAELGGWDEHIESRTAFTQGFVTFGVAIHCHRGDFAAAERLLDAFGALANSADAQERTEYRSAATALAFAREDLESTMAAADAAVRGDAFGDADYRVRESLVIAIEVAITAGKFGSARELLERFGPTRLGRRSGFAAGQWLRLGALVRSAEGDADGVAEELGRAASLFAQISYPYWHARALLDLGQAQLAAGRAAEAEAALGDSRRLFESLAADRWIGIVDVAATRVPASASASA